MAKKEHSKKHVKKVRKKTKPRVNQFLVVGGVILGIAVIFLIIKFGQPSSEESVEVLSGDVLATVNGDPIFQEEIDELYERLPPQYKQFMTKESLLNQTIARELLLQAAEKENVKVADEEVYAVIDTMTLQSQITREQLEQQLAENNLTLDDMVDEYRKQLVITKLLNETVYSNIKVSSEEITSYYNENMDLFEQVRASHILVNSSDEASRLLDMVRRGADFSDLAKTYSIDTFSAPQGGDLGYFTRNRMVKEFADAAFVLDVGEVSDVVQTNFGYHIIKVTAKKIVPLNEARSQIEGFLRAPRQTPAVQQYIDSLWVNADIVFY